MNYPYPAPHDPIKFQTLVVVGDSLSDTIGAYGAPGWPEVFRRMTGVRTVNLSGPGIGAEVLADVLSDPLPRGPMGVFPVPSVGVIALGANDTAEPEDHLWDIGWVMGGLLNTLQVNRVYIVSLPYLKDPEYLDVHVCIAENNEGVWHVDLTAMPPEHFPILSTGDPDLHFDADGATWVAQQMKAALRAVVEE